MHRHYLFRTRCENSGDALFSFNLGAMHDAPRMGIEGSAPVQHREIVPHEQIANLPFVMHGESLLRGMRPQCIKHLLAVDYIHADDVAVWPTAKEHRPASGFWIRAPQRVPRPHRLADVGNLLVSLAQKTGTIARSVMD